MKLPLSSLSIIFLFLLQFWGLLVRPEGLFAHNLESLLITKSVLQRQCFSLPSNTVESSLRIISHRPALIGVVPICEDIFEQIYTTEEWFRESEKKAKAIFGDPAFTASTQYLFPEYSSLLEKQSQIILNIEFDNGIELLGLKLSETSSTEIESLLETNIYWSYRGRIWIQRLILNNLALWNDSEMARDRQNSIMGYYRKYSAPITSYSLVPCERSHQCLRIENIDYTSSGVSSQWRSVNNDSVLIQGGWIRTDGLARGFIGINWNATLSGDNTRSYQYTVSTWSGTDWHFFTNSFLPPKNASKVQVWLLNFGSEGVIEFRQPLLVALSLPKGHNTGFTLHNGHILELTWEDFLALD